MLFELFDLGRLLATTASLDHLELHRTSPIELVERHLRGDWGDVCMGDRCLNDDALRDGSRLLSAYIVAGLKLYVITQADRSYTTILLASEY
jgi:hypothetical protein